MKMENAKPKKIFSVEHRRNLSIALTGRRLSNETKEKLRKVNLGRTGYWRGKKRSEETKIKISMVKKGVRLSPEAVQRIRLQNLGNKSHFFKCGRTIDSGGYTRILKHDHPYANNNHYVLLHRLVVEKYLGRILKPSEAVHHINGDKNDNRLCNLMVFVNNSSHIKFERGKEINRNDIVFDGRYVEVFTDKWK